MFGPWKKITELRGKLLILEEFKSGLATRVGELTRAVEDAQTVARTYAEANGSLIAEVTDLRNENAALKDKVKHAHWRDPNTGRLGKKGQWYGHDTKTV